MNLEQHELAQRADAETRAEERREYGARVRQNLLELRLALFPFYAPAHTYRPTINPRGGCTECPYPVNHPIHSTEVTTS